MPHVRYALRQLIDRLFRILNCLPSIPVPRTELSTNSGCMNLRSNSGQIRPEEYVPGAVLNQAIEQTDSEIIVLLNADAFPATPTFWNS